MRIFLTLTTIIISVLVCGVVWALQTEEYRHYFIPNKKELVGSNLYNFDVNTVRHISITNANGIVGEFEWRPSTKEWFAHKPWNDRASSIQPLLIFAENAVIRKTISTDLADASDFGFDKESHQVTIKDGEKKILADFHIGITSAWKVDIPDAKQPNPCIYIRKNNLSSGAPTLLCDDPQHIIREYFVNDLIRLRDYAPINPFKIPEIEKIQIVRNGSTIELLQTNADSTKLINSFLADWTIKKPIDLRTDDDKVKSMLTTFMHLKAQDIIDKKGVSLPELNTDTILINIFFHGEEAPTLFTIFPSTLKNNIVLATVSDRPNIIFQLQDATPAKNQITYKNLPESVNDLRARDILTMESSKIERVAIHSKDAPPVRLKKERNWKYYDTKNAQHEVNKEALEEFVLSLYKKNILSFISDAPSDLKQYELDDPRIKLYLIDTEQNPFVLSVGKPLELLIDGKKEIGYYAKADGQDSIWFISTRLVSILSQSEYDWLTNDIVQLSIGSIKNITRRRKGKETQFIDFDFASDRLNVYEGEELDPEKNINITYKVDAIRASYFIKILCSLKAEHRLDPNDVTFKKYLENPILEIDVLHQDYDTMSYTKMPLIFAPIGKLNSATHFCVQNTKTGELFSIKRKVCENLFDNIRYKNSN